MLYYKICNNTEIKPQFEINIFFSTKNPFSDVREDEYFEWTLLQNTMVLWGFDISINLCISLQNGYHTYGPNIDSMCWALFEYFTNFTRMDWYHVKGLRFIIKIGGSKVPYNLHIVGWHVLIACDRSVLVRQRSPGNCSSQVGGIMCCSPRLLNHVGKIEKVSRHSKFLVHFTLLEKV